MYQDKKVSADTITRTVVLAVALLNQIIIMAGRNPLPFTDDGVYVFVSSLLTVGASLWAWWKNNSFTRAAIKADEVLEKEKERGKL